MYTDEQKLIIAHQNGPAYVVAGAGTGKTFTMTARVQSLIERGVAPEAILVLTFTNAAANEMVQRLKKNIGSAADAVTACTYHSFCNLLMRYFGVPSRDFTILDSSDDEDLIKFVKANSIYADVKLPRASILKSIYSKRINCNKGYEEILNEEEYRQYLPFIEEIRAFYRILQQYKEVHSLVNYDDMLLYCVDILRSEYGEKVKRRYQYIMVDEAQDSNFIQFLITGFLSKNIMYIGDPEQSIYGFRGSDLNLYLSIPEKIPGTQIYTLSNNYRCTQEILDVANSVIKKDNIPYKAFLKTGKNHYGTKPILYQPSDQNEEALLILNGIKSMASKESAAVIYRNSIMSAKLELLLVQNHIDYAKRGGIKFFEMSCIRDMMALLKLLVNQHDYLSWFRILQVNRMIGEKRANQIAGNGDDPLHNHPFAGKTTKTANEICNQLLILEQTFQMTIDKEFPKQIDILQQYYLDLRKRNLEILKSKPKIKDQTIDAEETAFQSAKTYVPVLATLAKEYPSVRNFLESISLDLSATPESIAAIGQANEGQKNDQPANIVLTTIHSAKGLEWDHVFLMDAVQGVFPKMRTVDLFATEEDAGTAEERRCMYVAITRARNQLAIFCPESVTQYGQWYDGEISEFLRDALEEGLLVASRENKKLLQNKQKYIPNHHFSWYLSN